MQKLNWFEKLIHTKDSNHLTKLIPPPSGEFLYYTPSYQHYSEVIS